MGSPLHYITQTFSRERIPEAFLVLFHMVRVWYVLSALNEWLGESAYIPRILTWNTPHAMIKIRIYHFLYCVLTCMGVHRGESLPLFCYLPSIGFEDLFYYHYAIGSLT